MPSQAPKSDASKKRHQLARRRDALIRCLQQKPSDDKLLAEIENYGTATLSLLKAQQHWAEEALIGGNGSHSTTEATNRPQKLAGEIEKLGSLPAHDVISNAIRTP